ncbi:hypothetical protein SprV_0702274900 [Sparganum proliferum]
MSGKIPPNDSTQNKRKAKNPYDPPVWVLGEIPEVESMSGSEAEATDSSATIPGCASPPYVGLLKLSSLLKKCGGTLRMHWVLDIIEYACALSEPVNCPAESGRINLTATSNTLSRIQTRFTSKMVKQAVGTIALQMTLLADPVTRNCSTWNTETAEDTEEIEFTCDLTYPHVAFVVGKWESMGSVGGNWQKRITDSLRFEVENSNATSVFNCRQDGGKTQTVQVVRTTFEDFGHDLDPVRRFLLLRADIPTWLMSAMDDVELLTIMAFQNADLSSCHVREY